MKAKQLLLILAVCTGACAITPAIAAESPLKCKIDSSAQSSGLLIVLCTVVDDQVVITQVQLNRGRCKSPVLTTQELDAAWTVINGDSGKAKLVDAIRHENGNMSQAEGVQFSISFGMDLGILKNPTAFGAADVKAARNDLSVQQLLNDPTNRLASDRNPSAYHFGDSMSFVTQCVNLIEYTIEANGASWTFSVQ